MDTNQGESAAVRALGLIEAAALHTVLATALVCPAVVAKFDRLAGTHVASRGSLLNRAIDPTSGRTDAGLNHFIAFAKVPIERRLDHATRDAIRAQVASGVAR